MELFSIHKYVLPPLAQLIFFVIPVLIQYVPQDNAKLIELQGGADKFIARLDFIFDQVKTCSLITLSPGLIIFFIF